MNNPGIFKTVLVVGNQNLSAQSFKKLYSIMYSDKCSNDRDKEDKTIQSNLDYPDSSGPR